MKIIFISDTHGSIRKHYEFPEADVFVHAGDFMNSGKRMEEIHSFNSWLECVPVPKERRLICAGNHDILFDETHKSSNRELAEKARASLTNGVYLQDQEIVIEGIKFYFSPWTPSFLGWGFNSTRGEEIKKIWDKVPEDTNILVTHGPPHGILDQPYPEVSGYCHCGCEELENRIKQLPKLRYHVFGHIHGSRGAVTVGDVTYINASYLNEAYRPHDPVEGYFMVEINDSHNE